MNHTITVSTELATFSDEYFIMQRPTIEDQAMTDAPEAQQSLNVAELQQRLDAAYEENKAITAERDAVAAQSHAHLEDAHDC